ncbi:MAG: VOC family protein, partial [Acidimicrobiales bacterium]
MTTLFTPAETIVEATDPLDLEAVDAIELYVGNARQAAHYYRSGWGFRPLAYAGPETGVRDQCSYVLEQGSLRFVLTSSLREGSEVARHVARHGDGVKDI